MAIINKQDTNGTKPTLDKGELGYDDYAAGGDTGRVYVGDGTVNIPLAKKGEGALLGMITAIASNLTGAYPIPASGVVDADGWMYCNGVAIPSGKAVSGTLPNLTDGRFLRGSTSAGGTGGADSFTLATTNIPSHTHTMTHTHSTPNHGHTGSSNSTGSHSHYAAAGNNADNYSTPYDYGTNIKTGVEIRALDKRVNTSSAGSHSHTITVNSGGGGTTGGSSAGSTGSGSGSGTAMSHIPKYVNVQYVIKVN